jgi:hypothetical protein
MATIREFKAVKAQFNVSFKKIQKNGIRFPGFLPKKRI